jgi:hypothetical protein
MNRSDGDRALNQPKRVDSDPEGRATDSYGQKKDKHGQTHEDKIADKAA